MFILSLHQTPCPNGLSKLLCEFLLGVRVGSVIFELTCGFAWIWAHSSKLLLKILHRDRFSDVLS